MSCLGALMLFLPLLHLSGGSLFLHSQPPVVVNAYSPRRLAFSSEAVPPMAKKVRHEMEMFGDLRVDNYYWLRDDTGSNPEVLSYINAENNYTEQVMSGVKQFEDKIYNEIRGRIKEDDVSVPVQRGAYYYYTRTLKGKEYIQYCRRLILNNTKAKEHVILDENKKAKGHDYYYVGAFEVSPNNKMVAYAEDTRGNQIYTVHIIDADKGTPIGKPLKGVSSRIEWAGDSTLVYCSKDENSLRMDKAWSHKILSDQSNDRLLYHEKDVMFWVCLYPSDSKQYIFVESQSRNTGSVFYLEISKIEDGLRVLTPRIYGIVTSANHRGNHFFFTRRNEVLYNNTELVASPIDNLTQVTILIPHRQSQEIEYFMLFMDHIAVIERENSLRKIIVYALPPIGEAIGPLHDGHAVDFNDPIYSICLRESQFSSSILQFSYSSMKTPNSVYDYDMKSKTSVLKKMDMVLGGFKASNYVMERKWVVTTDATSVPISILYRKGLVKLDGSDPLLLEGYGAYGASFGTAFEISRLTLVDKGFVYVIAHVRGGGEMGKKWHEGGSLFRKRNTFTDFIACAEYLIKNKYSSKEKLCIEGAGSGGTLIGGVLNMRPDLFRVAVADVPFVDMLTTMLDPTIPLTTTGWEEWGDPRKQEYYFYMKSYSPVDNIIPQKYPNILVTVGLYDFLVKYVEPTKFVAKLRATKTDDNMLLFKCELNAGHFSKLGRFEIMRQTAFQYTFILKALDMVPPVSK